MSDADNLALRRLLWLRHGCTGLYGDDGEMQCGTCMIDFKRLPVDDIERRLMGKSAQLLLAAIQSCAHQADKGVGACDIGQMLWLCSCPQSCLCKLGRS